MGIGKKLAGASGSDADLDALWPRNEDAGPTDWKSIFRFLTLPAPGRAMTFDAIGNLTKDQLEFLLTVENKDDQESNSRKEADRHGCGVFFKIMKRTGWTTTRLSSVPLRILAEHYAVDNHGKHPGVFVIQMQLNTFFKKIAKRDIRADKPKPKRRYNL